LLYVIEVLVSAAGNSNVLTTVQLFLKPTSLICYFD